MLDIVLLAKALLAGAVTAAAVMGLASWGAPRPWRRDACWSWAIGAGIVAASGATDQWPHWPALEDRARFLTLLVPLAVVVDTLAAAITSRSVAWGLRLGLAGLVAPVLLHDSVYLADLDGGNSAEWTRPQAAIILGGLAAVFALLWAMLHGLQTRTSTAAVMGVLTLDALAVALTVMLSGYFRGGLLGLGLSGAIAGATLAAYMSQPQSQTGSLGMSVIGIFTVVLVGRFFGNLSTTLAACLLVAPLLAWIAEAPRLRKLAPTWRGAVRLTCVGAGLMVVLIVAQRKFTAASAARSRPAEASASGERIEK